jgi:hypothetical protein
MKLFSLALLACCSPVLAAAQIGMYQHGSVVRMQMTDCTLAHNGLMLAFGPPMPQPGQESCPEYTLVSPTVVYLIVGKSSNQLIPLAEIIDFRLHRRELVVRIDDAKHEGKFVIKEMMVRTEWDRLQRHLDKQASVGEAHEGER